MVKFEIDRPRIEAAIAAAEARSTGEIRVSIAGPFWGNVRKAAERTFTRLGMAATRERNGVLLFLVPARRRFVVLGDLAIHEKVGQEFWDRVAGAMSGHLRRGEWNEAIEHGVAAAGEELARHFPPRGPRDGNQLPDAVDFGEGRR